MGKTLDCIKLAVSKGYKALEDGSVKVNINTIARTGKEYRQLLTLELIK